MLITQIIIYLFLSIMYRQRQCQHIFILKSLQTLKISKYRDAILKKIEKHNNRSKFFIIWPALDMYDWYENWQEDRNRNA